MIDAYASHRHLVDHLAPVWQALDPEQRGRFYVAHRKLVEHAASLGIDARFDIPQMPGGLTLVASHADYTQCHPDRPLAYLEHGAGQTYVDHPTHGAYSGGRGRQRVRLFLTLNETTAHRERASYPEARVEVVGSPRLDVLALRRGEKTPSGSTTTGRALHSAQRPVVACSYHWRCNIVPETRSGFTHWRGTFADMAANGWKVLGTAHPRLWREAREWYERKGIEAVEDFGDVVARADVVCVDNSSALYEAAALGIPVVALNNPWYRTDVEHGLRFWSDVPGPQASSPDGLLHAIDRAFTPEWRRRRIDVTRRVYPPWTRRRAAELAARALAMTLAEQPVL